MQFTRHGGGHDSCTIGVPKAQEADDVVSIRRENDRLSEHWIKEQQVVGVTTCAWDPQDRLVAVYKPSQRTFTFVYNAAAQTTLTIG